MLTTDQAIATVSAYWTHIDGFAETASGPVDILFKDKHGMIIAETTTDGRGDINVLIRSAVALNGCATVGEIRHSAGHYYWDRERVSHATVVPAGCEGCGRPAVTSNGDGSCTYGACPSCVGVAV